MSLCFILLRGEINLPFLNLGIIPALESSHAVHYALRLARNLGPGKDVVICLSGRGDKDLDIVTSEPYLSAMISSDLPDVSQ